MIEGMLKKKNGNADEQQQSWLVAMGKTLPAHQLESIAEYIAKKFREECEKDKTLKDLIGTRILSRALIRPWINANALPKTQAAFVEMMMSGEEKMVAFEKARKMATRANNPDQEPMREILYERVDTKVSMESGKKKSFEFNQSQLFSAVESAIIRVFENTNLACVESKRVNCIERIWWYVQVLYGGTLMKRKNGVEINNKERIINSSYFSPLRKIRTKAAAAAAPKKWDKIRSFEHFGVPLLTPEEISKHFDVPIEDRRCCFEKMHNLKCLRKTGAVCTRLKRVPDGPTVPEGAKG